MNDKMDAEIRFYPSNSMVLISLYLNGEFYENRRFFEEDGDVRTWVLQYLEENAVKKVSMSPKVLEFFSQ